MIITRHQDLLPLVDFPDGEYKETPDKCKESGKNKKTFEKQVKENSVSWFDESVASDEEEKNNSPDIVADYPKDPSILDKQKNSINNIWIQDSFEDGC